MTTELARRLTFVFVLVALCTSFGCGSPSAQATVYIDEKKIPADMRSDYESFAVNCSKCHSLARAFNANVTDPMHWDLYVARMMRTAGGSISPAEKPHILRFLHWYTETYIPAEKAAGAAKELGSENPSEESKVSATDQALPQPSTASAPEGPQTAAAPSEAPPVAAPPSEPPQASEVPAPPPAEDQ